MNTKTVVRDWGTIAFLFSMGLMMMPNPCRAIPVSYDETVSGDIGFFDHVFDFDVGNNTISGTMTDTSAITDFDFFGFIIPAETELTSVAFAFSNVSTEPGTTTLVVGPNLYDQTQTVLLASSTVNILGNSPVSIWSSALPLSAGTYDFEHFLVKSAEGGGSWDYTITFDVSSVAPVPLPSTLSLFASGLAGLGWLGMRRKGLI